MKSKFPLPLHNYFDGAVSDYWLPMIMVSLVELGVQRCIIRKEIQKIAGQHQQRDSQDLGKKYDFLLCTLARADLNKTLFVMERRGVEH